MRRAQRERAAVWHGIDCVCCQRNHSLLQLPNVSQDHRQIVFGFDFDPDVVPALLVSNQTRSAFDHLVHIHRHALPGTQPAEIE